MYVYIHVCVCVCVRACVRVCVCVCVCVGGMISTGSHGSSLAYGTTSDQVTGLTLGLEIFLSSAVFLEQYIKKI